MEPTTKSPWRIARRILISVAVLTTIVAIFYTEEDWRGKRAWENCKHELEAKGEVLDWNAFIPPPVSDDQNFFAAPKMQQWFVRDDTEETNQFHVLFTNMPKSISVNLSTSLTNTATAAIFLTWSDQYQSEFDMIRDALKRPDSRMDGDYSVPYQIPIANFISVRALAQVLARRAESYMLLGQPDKALEQLTLLNDSRRIMERLPTSQPMTLVDAMINVAVTGLYTDTIAYGFQHHAWQEPQLAALQAQLAQINLEPFIVQAFRSESASMSRNLEITPDPYLISNKMRIAIPHGWMYQNMALMVRLNGEIIETFDLTNDIVLPQRLENVMRQLDKLSGRPLKPYSFIVAMAMPNYTKAGQVLSLNQTKVNEAQIACALERYRMAYGVYPSSLDDLVPHFMDKLPADIIDGGPLIYRQTNDGKFLLYSIGWNEKDDGGQTVWANKTNKQIDYAKGDWVWQN